MSPLGPSPDISACRDGTCLGPDPTTRSLQVRCPESRHTTTTASASSSQVSDSVLQPELLHSDLHPDDHVLRPAAAGTTVPTNTGVGPVSLGAAAQALTPTPVPSGGPAYAYAGILHNVERGEAPGVRLLALQVSESQAWWRFKISLQ